MRSIATAPSPHLLSSRDEPSELWIDGSFVGRKLAMCSLCCRVVLAARASRADCDACRVREVCGRAGDHGPRLSPSR